MNSILSQDVTHADVYHIVPLNDLKPHIESGEHCHCKPRIQTEENGKVVIHNAYDGREFYEILSKEPSGCGH